MATVTVVSEIEIRASPEQVFSLLSILKNHYIWNPYLKKLSKEGALALGSQYQADSIILKKTQIKSQVIVDHFIPNQSITLKSQMGAIKYTQSFNLEKAGTNTLLHTELKILTKSQPFGLTIPILKVLANKELKGDLELLKDAAEHPQGLPDA